MSAFIRAVVLAAASLCVTPASFAADWVIGQVAPFSGQMAQTGNDLRAGAMIAINAVNAKGGVAGRKLRIASDDDQDNPQLTAQKVGELLNKDRPIALFGTGGVDATEALLKSRLLERNLIPLVGPRTGANSVVNSNSSQVFVTRASYSDEVSALLRHCQVSGISSIAVIYQDDGFGRDLLATVEKTAPEYKISITSRGVYKRTSSSGSVLQGDAREAVSSILKRPHQAVLVATDVIGAAGTATNYRLSGGTGTVMTISTNDGELIAQRSGLNNARGIWVSQVVPAPRNEGVPLVRRFIGDLKAGGVDADDIVDLKLSSSMLEGYISMLVIIEGLRRAGPTADSAKLTTTIAGIRDLDLGGFVISFGGPSRSGSKFVEMGVVSGGGVVLR